MAEVGKIFLMKIVGMVLLENKEVKNCWDIEEGSVSGICKDDLMNKEGCNRGVKLTEVEERILLEIIEFCMHKYGCENEGASTTL